MVNRMFYPEETGRNCFSLHWYSGRVVVKDTITSGQNLHKPTNRVICAAIMVKQPELLSPGSKDPFILPAGPGFENRSDQQNKNYPAKLIVEMKAVQSAICTNLVQSYGYVVGFK